MLLLFILYLSLKKCFRNNLNLQKQKQIKAVTDASNHINCRKRTSNHKF